MRKTNSYVSLSFFRKLYAGMDIEDTKTRLPSILWIPLIVCFLLLFFIDVFQFNVFVPPSMTLITDVYIQEKILSGFEIKTPGCKIPAMDPWDQNVKKFIHVVQPPKCNKGIPALFESNLTSIYYLNSSLPYYNISDIRETKCCYRAFWRINPNTPRDNDNRIEFGKKCYDFIEHAKINHEFIDVKCLLENTTIYRDMFAFVPVKNVSKNLSTDSKRLSVLVVGLDAVSRLNLHRQMPSIVHYLKEIGGVELRGYNKVGDNTFPNLMPVLTGKFEEELRKTCWPKISDRLDKCHFIWEDYKNRSYVTAYGEDSSWMGLFNYGRKGFEKQPTDYGYSYFNAVAEATIGNSHNMNVNECIGARQVYKDFLDYIAKFTVTMDHNKLPYFAFFWGVSLSHDYLNKPKLGERDYTNFFKSLHNGGHLENTVLIFLSDHGIRWGSIRETYQGRMEERLPFVIIRLPKWFTDRYKRAYYNLAKNTRRLSTPFDLHETLVDLLNPLEVLEQNLSTDKKSRGVSLFREISEERTCEQAGIKSHWCTCQQSKEIKEDSTEVRVAADFAVQYINKELEGYAQCAKLVRNKTLNARLMVHDDDIGDGDNKIQDYMLTIQTTPGGGVFEVTIRHVLTNSRYDVIGTISRLNLYGKQSACILDYHLKLYCYCKSLLG